MYSEKLIEKQKRIKQTEDKITRIEKIINNKYDSLSESENMLWYVKNGFKLYTIYLYEAYHDSYIVKKKFQDLSYSMTLNKVRKYNKEKEK